MVLWRSNLTLSNLLHPLLLKLLVVVANGGVAARSVADRGVNSTCNGLALAGPPGGNLREVQSVDPGNVSNSCAIWTHCSIERPLVSGTMKKVKQNLGC